MSESTSPVRVAVVQFDPQVGTQNRAANLSTSLELALEAVNNGANLIVLPELTSTGYFFQNRQDAFDHADELQVDGRFFQVHGAEGPHNVGRQKRPDLSAPDLAAVK